jgi:hypothetical protein
MIGKNQGKTDWDLRLDLYLFELNANHLLDLRPIANTSTRTVMDRPIHVFIQGKRIASSDRVASLQKMDE